MSYIAICIDAFELHHKTVTDSHCLSFNYNQAWTQHRLFYT